MMFRTATMTAGLLVLALSAGTAVAQYNSAYPPPSQQGVAGPAQSALQSRRAQIKADVQAGRISRAEGKQLRQQLKAERAQRRAQRQARRNQGYQPANYPPSPPPQ